MKTIKIFEQFPKAEGEWVSKYPELERIADIALALKEDSSTIFKRHNLMLEPQEFLKNELVMDCMNRQGLKCLPITIMNNQIVAMGTYPTDVQLGM